MGLEEQKLNEWFNGERDKGLVDFKVTMNPFSGPLTREQICADINACNRLIREGKTVPINWIELDS